jgi:HD superfamily phosphohydrolase
MKQITNQVKSISERYPTLKEENMFGFLKMTSKTLDKKLRPIYEQLDRLEKQLSNIEKFCNKIFNQKVLQEEQIVKRMAELKEIDEDFKNDFTSESNEEMLKQLLSEKMSNPSFHTWIQPNQFIFDLNNKILSIHSPNGFC